MNSVNTIKNELDRNSALLVSGGPNRFYLTGFNSSAGYVLITKNYAYFLIDFRYYEKAFKIVKDCKVMLSKNPFDEIKRLCEENGVGNIYTETESLSLADFKRFTARLKPLTVSESDSFDNLLKNMRAVKSESELEYIKQAQRLTDKTFSYILSRINTERTEREIMLDMEFYMRKLGSDGVSFDFIVVSGKNSSLPHGVPTDKRIERGDFVTMDFGAVVNGYRSDMTRTVAVGYIIDEQRLVYNTVLNAKAAAVSAVKSGAVCSDIDKIARDIINNAGFEGCFGHALGHSVGIEIHESPIFSPKCSETLKSGNVITVEPGIYIENKFGVRIEDMVFVTEDGCKDITESPDELLIV